MLQEDDKVPSVRDASDVANGLLSPRSAARHST